MVKNESLEIPYGGVGNILYIAEQKILWCKGNIEKIEIKKERSSNTKMISYKHFI